MQINDIRAAYEFAIIGTTFESYGLSEHYYPVIPFGIAEALPKPAVRAYSGAKMELVDGFVKVFGSGAAKTIPNEAMVFSTTVDTTRLPRASQTDENKSIINLSEGILGHFREAGIPVLRHDWDEGLTSSVLSFRLPLRPDAFSVGKNLAIALRGPKNNL